VAATLFVTIYLFRDGLAKRLLTGGYALGAIAVSLAAGAAWLVVLGLAGLHLGDMTTTNMVSLLALLCLPLMLILLVPWSLGRYRHF